jgi:hypothetical protein
VSDIEMKLEVIVIPVSDVDFAPSKLSESLHALIRAEAACARPHHGL